MGTRLLRTGLLLATFVSALHAETETTSVQSEVVPETIRTESTRLDDVRDKFEKARQRVVVLTGQYDELEKERQLNSGVQDHLEGELTDIRGRLDALSGELSKLQAELTEANNRFAASLADCSHRLVALQEMRSYPLFGFVIRSQSFAEFMRRYEYARIITGLDIQTMERLSQQKAQMEAKKKELAAEQARIEALKDEKKKKNQALAGAITRGQEILDRLRLERVTALERASTLSRYSRALEDRIKSLRDRRAADALSGDATPGIKEQATMNRAIKAGSLGWPLDGDMEVVRPFGTVKPADGPGYFNPGVDVRILSQRTIKAVDAGRVIHRGRLPSFGNVLMIDHGGKGNKIISVYGNLDSIMVPVGQWVRRGDPVAVIGQGAGQAGNEAQLHLEIRKNAEPVDPLTWLER
jgi:septal ring factor EnvC (AmiA/AmiB activator)